METTIHKISNLTISASDTGVELSTDDLIGFGNPNKTSEDTYESFSPPRGNPSTSSSLYDSFTVGYRDNFCTSPPPSQCNSGNMMMPPPPVNKSATLNNVPSDNYVSVTRNDNIEVLPSITSMLEYVDALPGLVSDSSHEEVSIASSSSSSGSLIDRKRVVKLLELSKANSANPWSSSFAAPGTQKTPVSYPIMNTNTNHIRNNAGAFSMSSHNSKDRRSNSSIYRRRETTERQQSISRSSAVDKQRFGMISRAESFYNEDSDEDRNISSSCSASSNLQIPQFPRTRIADKHRSVLRPRPPCDTSLSSFNFGCDSSAVGSMTDGVQEARPGPAYMKKCSIGRNMPTMRDNTSSRRTTREDMISSRWGVDSSSFAANRRNRNHDESGVSSIPRPFLRRSDGSSNSNNFIRRASLMTHPVLQNSDCQIIFEDEGESDESGDCSSTAGSPFMTYLP